jgi:hypothetical protein
MSLPIHVDAYSGYKAYERPREFILNAHSYQVVEVEDRWYEPDAVYFKSSHGRSEALHPSLQ